jgi:cytoskeletal protein CcmA (bactofilin family)
MVVAGEMRDSFRQAMSEMFMGGDSENEKTAGQQGQIPARPVAPSGAPQQAVPTGRPAVAPTAAPVNRPVPAAAPAGRPAPATLGRSTHIRHVEQNPAEAQLAKMSKDIAEPRTQAAQTTAATPAAAGASAAATVTAEAPAANEAPPAVQAEGASEGSTQPRGPIRSSIIAEGTEITGEVKFGSDAEVYGVLNAKVMSEDDIVTNMGSIFGDVVAKNLDMLNAEIKGDVATYGDLRLSDASILTGDVAASRMDLRGQLVGNSAVMREMNVHSTAKLAGDVEAGSLAIGHGAKVRGYINVGFDEE